MYVMQPNSSALTTELLRVLLHVGQHERVGVGDEETVPEYVDDGADGEVLRPVELRSLGRASRLGDAGLLEELAAHHARVLDRRLVDGHHVVRQTVRHDEPSTLVQRVRRVLQSVNHSVNFHSGRSGAR